MIQNSFYRKYNFTKTRSSICLGTQYQVQNVTQNRRNQKVIENDNSQLVVENYHKNKNKQPIIQKQLSNCPSCNPKDWLEFD